MSRTTTVGRVLVVDDEAAVRKLCTRVLEDVGLEVESADSGVAAIARLAEGFDVILSDIQMPGLDGVQLLRLVRERDLDVPVILMTGAPTVDSAIRAVEYGAMRYVPKPFDPKALASTIVGAVHMRRLARTKREALELVGGVEGKLVGDRAGLEATFGRALASLWMAYQPIVSLVGRRVFAHEALLRSTEPALPHPGAVLDAAERLDCIHQLGRVVRRRVAETMEQTGDESIFFVNLHARDLLDEELVSFSAPLSRFAPRVVLEITERSSLDELRDVRARVKTLRDMGFRLAVDDLGAGYAGLTSFATIEPEIVKIDMSLVRGIDENPVKRRIVGTLISLAHELKIMVVAEGIETKAERDVLSECKCDLLQGYLFAKPGKPFPVVAW